jgi:DNA-binding response OmpR family regulator
MSMAFKNPFKEFTPTQERILTILADGMAHPRRELWDQMTDENDKEAAQNLSRHLSILRKRLRIKGEDIVCELNGSGYRICYRHVRLLPSAVNGVR